MDRGKMKRIYYVFLEIGEWEGIETRIYLFSGKPDMKKISEQLMKERKKVLARYREDVCMYGKESFEDVVSNVLCRSGGKEIKKYAHIHLTGYRDAELIVECKDQKVNINKERR